MSADHLLHFHPGDGGFHAWRLECIDGVCPQESWVERAQPWPDDNTCTCTLAGNDCDACRAGDHGGCGFDGRYIDEIGYACRAEHITGPGACWTISWFDELRDECLFGDDWPEDVLPLPVTAGWNGDCLELRYAGGAT